MASKALGKLLQVSESIFHERIVSEIILISMGHREHPIRCLQFISHLQKQTWGIMQRKFSTTASRAATQVQLEKDILRTFT